MPSVPLDQSPWNRSQKLSLAAVFSASFGVGLIFGFQPPFDVGALCLALTALPLLLVRESSAREPGPRDRLQWLRIARAAPIVMLAALIAGLVESAYVSLLPVFGLLRGLDERTSLLLVSVFLAGNVILQLPIGWLADRLGRRRVL